MIGADGLELLQRGHPRARKPERLKAFTVQEINWLFFKKPETARKPETSSASFPALEFAREWKSKRESSAHFRTEKNSREYRRGIANGPHKSAQNSEK